MKKLRIYVDTSVIGGCFDPEFKIWSDAPVNDFRRGLYVPVLSNVTAAEIAPAPEFVQALHLVMKKRWREPSRLDLVSSVMGGSSSVQSAMRTSDEYTLPPHSFAGTWERG